MKKIERTTEGLRSILFDTLDGYMQGDITDRSARTVAKMADSISRTVYLDIGYKHLVVETAKLELEKMKQTELNTKLVS